MTFRDADTLYKLRRNVYYPICGVSAPGRFVMPTVEEIKSAISSLSKEDYVRLREWFSRKDWERWDKEIESDSASGNLDFLMEEAGEERNEGRLENL